MKDKTYVIAGNARTADNYRVHKRIPKDEFQYISRPENICGLKHVTIIELYNFWENSHASDIMDYIEARNLDVKLDDW